MSFFFLPFGVSLSSLLFFVIFPLLQKEAFPLPSLLPAFRLKNSTFDAASPSLFFALLPSAAVQDELGGDIISVVLHLSSHGPPTLHLGEEVFELREDHAALVRLVESVLEDEAAQGVTRVPFFFLLVLIRVHREGPVVRYPGKGERHSVPCIVAEPCVEGPPAFAEIRSEEAQAVLFHFESASLQKLCAERVDQSERGAQQGAVWKLHRFGRLCRRSRFL
mmetsp:Transcript_41813/g.82566  ORF Transcript_41813/g.82566 Transcript_41813/m.82566 type:complete len:221 (-) Transcript_41813:501-1163(-)